MARGVAVLLLLGRLAFAEETADMAELWRDFKARFGGALGDEAARFEIFSANVAFVREANRQGLPYRLGINAFADLTASEFAARYGASRRPPLGWGGLPRLGSRVAGGVALDAEVDWSARGAVTPVKNQGQCGSCWSFSTTGALEGAWQIATGTLQSLSVQQFVDCDGREHACSGGWVDKAFAFATTHALCTEDSYRYTGQNGTCQESTCTVGIPMDAITGFMDVPRDSARALMEALMQQPVSIEVDAEAKMFQFYKSGVLTGACGSTLNHAILAVGYGTEQGVDYWKVKNSWGTSWGEQGFGRLFRGEPGAGECGLLSGPPSFPVVRTASAAQAVISI